MAYIPEEKIDEVREAANIVEVISTYVNLKRAGRLFRGLCPFHAETTPSFTVNPQRRIFHCFGCGVGGNAFRFLMLHKGISFPEAVAELAERYGVELPRTGGAPPRRSGPDKATLYRAAALAQTFFEDELHASAGRRARDYLAGRGLSLDLIREFGLGWAPPGWDNLRRYLASKGVEPEVMAQAGLVKPRADGRSYYDVFRGRIIWPIFDLDGKVVAFGGRLLDEEEGQPKYLNSPETPIYRKGRLLYGLNRARPHLREKRLVLIVEGYFDLLALAAHGFCHVVATLGTALTPAHLRLLKGYVDQAVVVFDADEAGRAAAARALPLFMSADLEGRVLTLPEGYDPDTYLQAHGAEGLARALEETVGLLDFYLDQTLARYPRTLAGKSGATQEVLRVVAEVQGAARQDLLRRALAERLDVSEEALQLSTRRQKRADPDPRGVVERVAADFEVDLLRLVLLHPETWSPVFAADLEPLFEGAQARRIFSAMAAQFARTGRMDTGRLFEELEPEEADLVSGLLISEDGLEEKDLALAAADFIERFRSRRRQRQAQDLSRRIKAAQEASDQASLERLLAEKNKILKEKSL